MQDMGISKHFPNPRNIQRKTKEIQCDLPILLDFREQHHVHL